MRNNYLISIARDTIHLGDLGFYFNKYGEKVFIKDDINFMNDNTCVYKSDNKNFVDSFIKEKLSLENLIVMDRTTNDSIESWSSVEDISKIIVLNFASAKNPGGGFLKGRRTQEEQLCYTSMLYKSLITKMKDYYEVNRNNLRDGLYNNIAIYSKRVPFIRNSKYDLIRPLLADVVTCPAVNRREAEFNSVSNAEILFEMYNRCNLVIETIMENLEDNCVIILGAFGCGAFKNNPSQVANIFKLLLNNYRDIIIKRNVIVEFAIPKGPNLNVFKEILE